MFLYNRLEEEVYSTTMSTWVEPLWIGAHIELMYRISAHFSQSGLEPFNMHGIYRCLDTNTLMHHLLHFIMSHFKKKVSGENEIHTFSSTMIRCKNMSELGSFMSVGCFHIRTTLTIAFVRWLNSQVSHNQDSSCNWFPP